MQTRHQEQPALPEVAPPSQPLDTISGTPIVAPSATANTIPFPGNRSASTRTSPPPLAEGLPFVLGHCRLFSMCQDPKTRSEVPPAAYAVMISNAAKLKGGRQLLHQVSQDGENYALEALDAQINDAAQPSVASMQCSAVRECSSICPPEQNCIQPNGQPVKSPSQLLSWAEATDNSKDVPHRRWAQAFVDRFYPEGLVFIQSHFWGYEKGAFRRLDIDVDIKQPLMALVEDLATDRFVGSLTKFLKTWVAQPADFFDVYAATHLCLDNGTLNLETYELEPHSSNHRLQTRLKNKLEEAASCPKFLAFLDQIFAHDPDKAEKVRFVQQWMGYLLTPDVSQQLMAWLVGDGSNGKSVLIDVIRALIGEHNISAVALADLSNKFSRAHTAGKTLNISSDLPTKAVADGYMKAMIAGEAVEARSFNHDAMTFKSTARFMAAMNTLPKTTDLSDGFFRRIAILTFNRQFRGTEVNPNLSRELIEELPGILNWALEGLKDLRREGRFSIPTSSFEAIEQYRREADPVKQFADECLRVSSDHSGYTGTALRHVFLAWAKENGSKATGYNPTSFGRALRKLGFEKRHSGQDLWLVEPQVRAAVLFARADARSADFDPEDEQNA